jgi:hypothetical protein
MNCRSLLIFLGLNKLENEFLICAQCRARSGPGLQLIGRGGLPCAAGRQAGWASAWRPGPTKEVAHDTGTGCASRACLRCGHCAHPVCATARWRACRWLSGGWPAARCCGELVGAIGRAPGKEAGGGAHPNGGAAWRRWRSLGTMMFVSGETAPVAGGDGGTTLQCR